MCFGDEQNRQRGRKRLNYLVNASSFNVLLPPLVLPTSSTRRLPDGRLEKLVGEPFVVQGLQLWVERNVAVVVHLPDRHLQLAWRSPGQSGQVLAQPTPG